MTEEIQERVSPECPDWNYENHRKVYRFFADQVAGLSVLDVGCGTGYGAEILRASGRCAEYTGIDFDPVAVADSRRLYGQLGRFLQMDAQALTFEHQIFDCVVSSENLEHLPDPDRALAEKARVVKPQGLVMVGTPNKEMFSPGEPGSPNPFHVDEFDYGVLWRLARRHFRHVCIFENLWTSEFPLGQKQKAERLRAGCHGVLHQGRGSYTFAGRRIDLTHLENTHSFMLLAAEPRKG